MGNIILITGGSRSGKSARALHVGGQMTGPRAYIATCPALDEEMRERIRRHRQARRSAGWQTIEETTDLAGALEGASGYGVLVVDCLTLWINNLMHAADGDGTALTEDDVEERCRDVLDACAGHDATVIFVTNEVGMGIVPANDRARRFRDLAGRCNQMMASAADVVTLMISGIPLTVKGDRAN